MFFVYTKANVIQIIGDSSAAHTHLILSTDDSPAPACLTKVQSVDDFVPEERLDRSFLEDSVPSKTKVPQPAPVMAVDSDRWGGCNI